MEDFDIEIPKYNLDLYVNKDFKTIMVGNYLQPILYKFNELVNRYYNNDNDIIKIILFNNENNTIIKSYNSEIDK